MLSTYAPVYFLSVLISSILPAALEILVIPMAARWSHFEGKFIRGARFFLRNTTLTASLELDLAVGITYVNAVDLSLLAQRIVYRGIVNLLSTLLVALTFGIAVPVVGIASVLSAFVQLAHHDFVLRRIFECGSRQREPVIPNLMDCCGLPWLCETVVGGAAALTWYIGSLEYLESWSVLFGGLTGIALISLGFILAKCASSPKKPSYVHQLDYKNLREDGAELRRGHDSSI